jgi:hypothetical protein
MPRQPIKGLAMGPWREREQLRKARGSGRNQLAHGDNHGIRSPRGVSRSPPWRATSKVRLRNSGSNDLQGPCTFFHYTALTYHGQACVGRAAVFDGLRFFLKFALLNARANCQPLARSGAWGGAVEPQRGDLPQPRPSAWVKRPNPSQCVSPEGASHDLASIPHISFVIPLVSHAEELANRNSPSHE